MITEPTRSHRVTCPGRRARAAGLAAPLAAVFVLSACGSGSSDTANAAGSSGCTAPKTVSIAAFAPGVTLTTDMAQGTGAFDEVNKACNTTVKVVVFQAPQPMLAGLLQGQFQFAVVTAPNQINQAVQGKTITNLLNLSQGGTGVIVTSAANADKGKGLDQIKAAGASPTWALTSVGGISSLYASAMSAAAGQPAKINGVAVGLAGVVPSVTSGRARLGLTTAIPAATAIAAKQAVAVLNASGITAYRNVGFFPGSGLLTTPAVLAKYPAMVQAVTVAELKGMKFLRDNQSDPQAIYDKMPDSFKKSTSIDVWKASFGWNISTFTPATGLITQEQLVSAAKTMQKYGLAPNSFDTSKITADFASSKNLAAAFQELGVPVPTQPVDEALLASLPD
jgi:ABC-type nitrate/sulfonate/bicarbonate transport system substrate-binding protein